MKAEEIEALKRIAEAVEPEIAPLVRKAADDFYERLMWSVQDYLADNVAFNLTSHIDMLERTRDNLRTENAAQAARIEALLSELASLRSEREGMREGLKPFAREADEWWDELPDSYVPGTVEAGVVYPGMAGGDAKYTVGDLRRARALLLQGETP